jgi:predicted nucleic acid-binding protein
MILLDTNVVSEIIRPHPDRHVVDWLNRQSAEALHISAPVIAEIRFGIALLPSSKRKLMLDGFASSLTRVKFRDRVFPFDTQAAEDFADVLAGRRLLGRPIDVFDAMIAAIARVRGAKLATRNVSDFELLGLDLINPFEIA